MFSKIGTAPFSLVVMLVGTFVPLAFTVAIFADGNWTFNINTLSDLGISEDDFARMVFTVTCIIGGIFTAFFGFGKYMMKHGLDSASGFLLVLAGVLLIAVGLFNKETSVHIPVAMGYFLMMTAAIIVSLVADYRSRRFLSMSVAIIVLLISYGSMPGFDLPGTEVISVFAICVWMFAQGVSLSFSNDYNTESDNRVVTE